MKIVISGFSLYPGKNTRKCKVLELEPAKLPYYKRVLFISDLYIIQWNLIIKRSDITKPSYNKVILLVPALYISLFFYPDIMRNLI